MANLFNTPEGAEFIGIHADSQFGLEKAKKGTPEYEEWLRKYREKKGAKKEDPDAGEKKAAAKDALTEDKQETSRL